jgi:hypothetical protein
MKNLESLGLVSATDRSTENPKARSGLARRVAAALPFTGSWSKSM